ARLEAGGPYGGTSAGELPLGPRKDADLLGRKAGIDGLAQQQRGLIPLLALVGAYKHLGLGPFENRDRAGAIVRNAIEVAHAARQQPVRRAANLVRGAIIYLERD